MKSVQFEKNTFRHVLLVETAAADLSSLRRKLRNRSLRVEVSESIRQALRSVREDRHDIVIAGPRLDRLRLRRLTAGAGSGQRVFRSLISNLVPVFEAKDPPQYLAMLAAMAGAVVGPLRTFALLCDRVSGEPDMESMSMQPARGPDLGGVVRKYFGPDSDAAGGRSPSEIHQDPRLWLLPVMHQSRMEALLCVLSCRPSDEPEPGALETLRLLSRLSGSFLSTLRDSQQQRRTSHELEATLRVRSRLVSIVCHESRSLLASVRGYSKRILDGRAGSLSDMQRDHLGVVLKNTDKLLDLISYSAPFAAEQQLSIEFVDVREIWHGAFKRQQERVSEKALTVTEKILGEPFTIAADRAKLSAVFDIVAGYAIQSSSTGGELRIQLSGNGCDEVVFSLVVVGLDLPQELVDRFFDHQPEPPSAPFRVEKQREARLSLAHDMVWLHGGRMAVTRHPVGDTAFFIALPKSPPLPQ